LFSQIADSVQNRNNDGVDLAPFMIPPERLWSGETPWSDSIAIVDLNTAPADSRRLVLPACPVLGIGSAEHSFAAFLDCVVETPVSAEAVARQVLAKPRAAAVVTGLLRLLPSLSAEQGLTAESLAYAALQGSAEHHGWLAGNAKSTRRSPGRIAVKRAGATLTINLDHPESGNAIDQAMRDALFEAFSLAAVDPEIASVRLRAAGRTFSLGAELGEFGTTTDPATAHYIRTLTLPAHPAARCADRLQVHIQGGCVGSGLELAAWARRITASPDAWFQLPELAMGILPGAGGCVSLTQRIGRQRTALMILSGKRISARQALAWGLIDAIVEEPPTD